MSHQEKKAIFEEKILYKTRQHGIISCIKTLKFIVSINIPFAILVYFLTNFSGNIAILTFILTSIAVAGYIGYLWYHSWLMIGNQKISLIIRNGIFSQYAMSIRYRNIRDCAVSKKGITAYLFKYGTLFIRSSGAEGDFEAKFVPKVGKIYALINALSRYSDDDRSDISSIEELHNHHHKNEFSNIEHTVERHG